MPAKPSDSDPAVSLSVDALEVRIAAFAKAQGITNDAGWATAVATAFNGTNASGLSASTRALMIQFFTNLVKIG